MDIIAVLHAKICKILGSLNVLIMSKTAFSPDRSFGCSYAHFTVVDVNRN